VLLAQNGATTSSFTGHAFLRKRQNGGLRETLSPHLHSFHLVVDLDLVGVLALLRVLEEHRPRTLAFARRAGFRGARAVAFGGCVGGGLRRSGLRRSRRLFGGGLRWFFRRGLVGRGSEVRRGPQVRQLDADGGLLRVDELGVEDVIVADVVLPQEPRFAVAAQLVVGAEMVLLLAVH
jgi:hypothetical protein